MTTFMLFAAALCLVAIASLTRSAWWPSSTSARAADDPTVALGRQIKQLRDLHAAGALGDEQYAQSKAAVERKLLEAVAQPAARGERSARPSAGLLLTVGLFVVVVAAGGYALIGSPSNLTNGPGSGADVAQAHSAGGDGGQITPQQIAAMVDQLAERLKSRPEDAEGWTMLARAYAAMGRHAQALDAFKKAVALRPNDANVWADFAEAQAMVNGRTLQGEPMKLVERALQVDPKNVKALSLAGTDAFDRKDYAGAVKFWEQVAQSDVGDPAFVQQVRAAIAQARQLGGLQVPAGSASAALASSAAPRPSVSKSPAHVSGVVSLSASLAGRASPDDTVFVFARPANGSRMPLAIMRRPVKDLPFAFTLDDSLSMSPQATLSGASQVIVGARITKSGNAMPQAGDLQGSTPAVAVGTDGLKLQIDQEVQK